MPRHCLPWVLAAALAAIGFQAMQNRVVSVPADTTIALPAPAPLPELPASYAY
jgi:hypothetical protein